MTKTILIAGGTGLIGQALSKYLLNLGYSLHVLTRKERKPLPNLRYWFWDLEKAWIEDEAFMGISGLINLTGAPIAGQRWNKKYMRELEESRIGAVSTITKYLKTNRQILDFIISGSAVGYYGSRGSEILDESSPKGIGYISDLVDRWESVSSELTSFTKVLSILRIGPVLSNQGGILSSLLVPAKFGIAPYFAPGDQWLPWIHIDDVSRLIHHLIDHELRGTYNAVSQSPITYKEVSIILARHFRKVSMNIRIPTFALKAILPKRSKIFLMSNRVYPQSALKDGFKFNFECFEDAILDLYPS